MNQRLSVIAFIHFTLAWLLSIIADSEIVSLLNGVRVMNVGLMWLTVAAIVGR